MKKLIALLALTAASGIALAQSSAPSTPKSAAPSSTQQPTAQTPGTPNQSGPGGTTAQLPEAQPTGKRQPQAKTQEEFKAYQDVAAKPDPASMEQAADAFVKQFPDSELKGAVYQNLMLQYQSANNSDKTVEIGRKAVQMDPDNAVALVTVASVLSNRTRETDLDKEERLAEAKKDANHAIELMNSGAGVPANVPAANAEAFKNTINSMAYASLGQAEFVSNNFPAAEQSLRKATGFSGIQPDPISWFQLTLTLDREQKYPDAVTAANKCIEVAGTHPVKSYCQQELERVQKLAANPPAAKPATPAATTTPAPTTPK